jgi:hypothetical protein
MLLIVGALVWISDGLTSTTSGTRGRRRLSGAELPEEYHDETSGHDSGSVGRSSGRIAVKVLKRALDRMKFDVSLPKWRR